ncbi:SNF2 family N-terminal domain-containing protein [Trametes meyenii]|nr:SNF2 family N-terminal domain-containing protein [Trametes meyenii]
MSEPLKPPATQRKSRVLAALDNPALFAPSPSASVSLDLPPASFSLPPLSQISVSRFETPLPGADYLALLGSTSYGGTKRKVSDPDSSYDEDDGPAFPSPSRPVASQRAFGLRYDQETAIRSIDRGGEDQQARIAEFVSQSIDNAAHGLTVQKAMERLGLQDKKDLIPGMEIRLLPHQLIGVSWMIDQERRSTHKGGILADDMGLGKTVQMIATMVINQPTDEDNRTTLIVVPAALMSQWKDELDTKTNGMFDIHIQHGKDKIKDPDLVKKSNFALLTVQVIITTYQTLNLDFSIPNDLDSDDELQYLRDHGGPLSRTRWYRVILDEAQFIRNRGTRASKAVAMLRSKYRWCLTGTPITNTLADIYGFLRFGRFRPWNDWSDFNEHIAKVQLVDAPLAGARAQEVLKPIMLRRTKDATVEGEPILQLPPKDVEIVSMDFSEDERQLYDSFEKRAQIQINKFIRERTLFKNHDQVFVWILRLRQLCCHPHLVLMQPDALGDPTLIMASDSEKERARAAKKMGQKWVQKIKERYLSRTLKFELDFGADDDGEEPVCPQCGDFFIDNSGRVLGCGHEICRDCMDVLASSPIEVREEFGNNDEQTNMRIEKEYEAAAAKGLRPCPTCKKMQDLTPHAIFLSSAFQPSEEELKAAVRSSRRAKHRSPSPPPAKKCRMEISLSDCSDSDSDDLPDLAELMKSSPKGKSGGKNPIHGNAGSSQAKKGTTPDKGKGKQDSGADPTQPSEYLVQTWKKGGSNVESSAKMVQMVRYLKEWGSSGDKTIVFSQWTSMLDLCEEIFARNGIRNLRYDGKMNRDAREFTLNQFRSPGGPRVILVSIKCGGVGLNLVSANRVINLDLSWNFATESQAYDRVHRLGQEKDVYVKRLVIKNTIEERMLTLQETKTHLADAALGEGSGHKLHKLSVKQIKDLFGMGRLQNERGQSQLPGA